MSIREKIRKRPIVGRFFKQGEGFEEMENLHKLNIDIRGGTLEAVSHEGEYVVYAFSRLNINQNESDRAVTINLWTPGRVPVYDAEMVFHERGWNLHEESPGIIAVEYKKSPKYAIF